MRVRTHVSLFRAAGFSLIVAAAFLLAARGVDATVICIPPFPPEPVPAANLMLTLSVDGKNVIDGDSLVVPQGVAVPVVIHARAMPGSSTDWSPDNSLGSQEGSLTDADKFYLDFYEGDLFYGATFVSGEQMNKDGPVLQSSSTVTFPGPGTYSAVLYDSGVARVGSGSSGGSLQDDRANIESWSGNPSSLKDAIGFVTFTVSADPCANGGCVSNVMFLPGIEGSRLYRPDYRGGIDKLWEPGGDGDVKDLYLNPDGSSARFDVYTKEGDVLDETPDGVNRYKSFVARMDSLKANGTINDWEPVAYDWRLSLDDILSYGHDIDGRIYYSGDMRATSTPYVIQELKRLAASSQTGKVTIVAHSNGGFLAKRLTELLGPEESAKLIDKMIFVAVPQAGTPDTIAEDMHGQELSFLGYDFLTKQTARTFASTSPMAYNLLPSAQYFTQVDDPVITFAPSLSDWISRYGAAIHSQELLHNFLVGDYGRVDSQTGNADQPIRSQEGLLSQAEALHNNLDNWTPPPGVSLIQIAGWGIPSTISGITYEKKGSGIEPDVNSTIDGDGTVVVPSALWTSTTTGAKNYWMNLRSYNADHPISSGLGVFAPFDHSRILETSAVLDFISDQIASTTKPLGDYAYLSAQSPSSTDTRLRYSLHSPLSLNLYDAQGRHTGVSTTTGRVEEQIPGTYYDEVGDVKYLYTDASTSARLLLNGYAPGVFTLDVGQYQGDTRTASTTFENIPTSTTTLATMDIVSDISTLSPLRLDENGDGVTDASLSPESDGTVTLKVPQPEFRLSFSTTTQALSIGSVDTVWLASVATTSSLVRAPRHGIPARDPELHDVQPSITTVTARDLMGSTTALTYTVQSSPHVGHLLIDIRSIAYDGAVTVLPTELAFNWTQAKSGAYRTFHAVIRAATTTVTAEYEAKSNRTILTIATRHPGGHTDNRVREEDEDWDDKRPRRLVVPGLVVPYAQTAEGNMIVSY